MEFRKPLQLFLAGFCLVVCCSCTCAGPQGVRQAAPVQPAACHGELLLRTELFFGLSVQNPDGTDAQVSEQQWQDFVDRVVTPRFSDGLTVLDSRGQWRHQGRIVKEKGKVLYLLHPLPGTGRTDDADRKIEEIREIYKQRFHQDSVLRTTIPAGVSF